MFGNKISHQIAIFTSQSQQKSEYTCHSKHGGVWIVHLPVLRTLSSIDCLSSNVYLHASLNISSSNNSAPQIYYQYLN